MINNQTTSNFISFDRTTPTTVVITPTTTIFFDSSTYIIFNKIINYIIYSLSFLTPIGLLLNFINLIILSINHKWKNSAKFYYLVTAISNICLAINFDVLKFFVPLGLSYVFYFNISTDDYSPIFCKAHNYLTPICEFIWMWNITTFAIKRCLIVCFPLKSLLISRIISWKINLFQLLLPLMLYWIHLANFNVHCYAWLDQITCFCTNDGLAFGYNQLSFTYYYELIIYQYMTYFIPMLLIIVSEIILIFKINIALKNRKKLTKKTTGSKNESSDNRLNLVVITTSTFYIIIILPWCVLAAFYQYIIFLPYNIYTLIYIWYFNISNNSIIFLRTCDVAILFIMVKDYWKLLTCKYF